MVETPAQPRALERRIKRLVHGTPHRALVVAPPGFRTELLTECEALSTAQLTPGHAPTPPVLRQVRDGIEVEGAEFSWLVEAVLRLRLATDLLIEVARGPVRHWEDVGRLVEGAPLDCYLAQGAPVRLRVRSIASRLFHEGRLRQEAEEALLERGHAVAPDELQGLEFEVRQNTGSLWLSLAGRPLYQRGYRDVLAGVAPLREDLAAAIVRAACASQPQVDADTLVLVPFCGTGTFAFESLLFLKDVAPGLVPREYAFESWTCHRAQSAAWLRKKLRERAESRPVVRAFCFDRASEAVGIADRNRKRFCSVLDGVIANDDVQVTHADLFRLDFGLLPWDGMRSIFVPLNPPYGNRLRTKDSGALFRQIGARVLELGRMCDEEGVQMSGAVLCPDEDSWREFLGAAKGVGHQTRHFTQGGLDVRLCVFNGGSRP